MADPTFKKLNLGWNADPNDPDPKVEVQGSSLLLRFNLNYFAFDAVEGEEGCLTFLDCVRWRRDVTNDHAWVRGEGRFADSVPVWGEFYQVFGDAAALEQRGWHRVGSATSEANHYIFYFRDEAYECFAQGFNFDRRLLPRPVKVPPEHPKREGAGWFRRFMARLR